MIDHLIPYEYKKYTSLLGSTLLNLSLGSVYTLGNIGPYIISYLRVHKRFDLRYSDSIYIWTLMHVFISIGIVSTGFLISICKFHIKTMIFSSSILISFGCLLTYFTIDYSYLFTLLSYGVLIGFGSGLCYTAPLALVMKWFPNSKGLVNSIVLLGFGGGPILFNQLQTLYINPGNYNPDKPFANGSDEKYFSQPDLLDRVPKLFAIQGSIYLGLLVAGLLMISEYHENPKIANINNGNEEEKSKLSPSSNSDKSVISEDINSLGIRYKQISEGMDFKNAIKTLPFYLIAIMLSLSMTGASCVITFYKMFGQTFLSDDRFLAIIGSLGSIFNSFGRLFWGFLIDRLPFKTCFLIITSVLITLISTIYLNRFIAVKEVYMIWICGVFFVNCGIFTVMPTIVARCFGQKHFNAIYGMIYSLGIPTIFLGSQLPKSIDLFGWLWFFLIDAGFLFIPWICALIFNVKTAKGKNL